MKTPIVGLLALLLFFPLMSLEAEPGVLFFSIQNSGSGGKIYRVDSDGTGLAEWGTSDLTPGVGLDPRAKKVYWSQTQNGFEEPSIARSDLDGSGRIDEADVALVVASLDESISVP